jgi:hypothetical protein
MAGKTGGGPGSNQYGPHGVSRAARRSRKPSLPGALPPSAVIDLAGLDPQDTFDPPPGPPGPPGRAAARFEMSLPEIVFADAHLEGNHYTEPEIKALIEGDAPPPGRTRFETAEAEGLAKAANMLAGAARRGPSQISRDLSDRYNTLLTGHEVIEPGVFRGEGTVGHDEAAVHTLGRIYTPPAAGQGGEGLRRLWADGLAALGEAYDHPVVFAAGWAAFAALCQFYSNGNKRTGRYVANTYLVSRGWDALLVPADRRADYNQALGEMFASRRVGPYQRFLVGLRAG